MKRAAKNKDFEAAVKYRNQLQCLQALSRQVLFGDREIQQANSDQALVELAQLVGLDEPPKRVEGFDISHQQGSDTTASLVVFVSGLPYKTAYRKFKMRLPGNDDFAHMAEAVSRRFSQRNTSKWGLPDLVLIDGGKGQLSAAITARDQLGYQKIPFIGLAKRFEDVIMKTENSFETIRLSDSSHLVKLLQRIRDESHRFAVSYHSVLKRRRQTASILDEIPGVGPATRKKLIRHFGSAKAVIAAEPADLAAVVGTKSAARLSAYLAKLR